MVLISTHQVVPSIIQYGACVEWVCINELCIVSCVMMGCVLIECLLSRQGPRS